jgi:hypothetical protein
MEGEILVHPAHAIAAIAEREIDRRVVSDGERSVGLRRRGRRREFN